MRISTKAMGCALLAGLSLAACSTAPADSGGPAPTSTASGAISGTLTILYVKMFQPALEPVVKAFEQKYPGTKVDVNYVSGDVGNLIGTQLQAGTAADIFVTLPGSGGVMNVHTLAAQGKLLDLSDSPWVAGIPRLWQSDMAFNGKTYAYPGTLQGLGAIYNMTKLKELGLKPPKTWSEVLGLCKSAKDHGLYAYAQGLNDSAGPQMMFLALSADLVYGPTPDFSTQLKEKKTTVPASPWRQVLDKYKQMNDAGCFGEGVMGRTRTQGTDEVAAGKALGIVDVGAAIAPIEKAAPKSELTILPMPATDDPAGTYFPALPGFTVSANAQAKNPAAAKAFLNMLAEPQNISVYAKGYASVPLIPVPGFKPPANLAALNEAIAAGKSAKIADWPNPKVNDVAQQGVQAILLGKDTIDEVLQKMQEAFEG
ncbi:extracellular solute-binding protein [Nonomuraea sp. NPDC049158]|uniref:ABC transporter substrate-binding protein n=1 Tax=Nonomuraea sp. NPDC049158 TaxID=3155649 RepID=UPI0033E31DD9